MAHRRLEKVQMIYLFFYLILSYTISPFIIYYFYQQEQAECLPRGRSWPAKAGMVWAASCVWPLILIAWLLDNIRTRL